MVSYTVFMVIKLGATELNICDHHRSNTSFSMPEPLNTPGGRANHWSAIIGASHSKDYVLWEYGGYASEGVKQVAELGSPIKMEEEIRQKLVVSRVKERGIIMLQLCLLHPKIAIVCLQYFVESLEQNHIWLERDQSLTTILLKNQPLTLTVSYTTKQGSHSSHGPQGVSVTHTEEHLYAVK
ncbi:spondin-1 precursor [Silurus meridionalis]|nr:spondin-1 precursor [Silurus meridionalis]